MLFIRMYVHMHAPRTLVHNHTQSHANIHSQNATTVLPSTVASGVPTGGGSVQPSPSIPTGNFNLPFETAWSWQHPIYRYSSVQWSIVEWPAIKNSPKPGKSPPDMSSFEPWNIHLRGNSFVAGFEMKTAKKTMFVPNILTLFHSWAEWYFVGDVNPTCNYKD